MKGIDIGIQRLQHKSLICSLVSHLIQTDESFTVDGRKHTHTYTHTHTHTHTHTLSPSQKKSLILLSIKKTRFYSNKKNLHILRYFISRPIIYLSYLACDIRTSSADQCNGIISLKWIRNLNWTPITCCL